MENLKELDKFADKHPKFTDLIPLLLYEVCIFIIIVLL